MIDALTTLADEYWAFRLREDGMQRLWRGDTDHLELMEDVSLEGAERRFRTLEGYARQADDLRDHPLAETISFTARASSVETPWEYDIGFPNHAVGAHALVLAFLPRHRLTETGHASRFIGKVAATATMFDQLSDRLRHNVGAGRTPIRLAVSRTAEAIDRYLASDIADDPVTAVDPPPGLDPLWADAFRHDLRVEVEMTLRPALGRYRDTLVEEVLPAARPDDRPGICHLDGGEEAYQQLVWAHTSTDLTPGDVHDIGLAQVERLAGEYRELAGPLTGTSDVGEILARLRGDPDLHYRSAEDLVADAERALARATAEAPRAFHRVPRASCSAEATERGALAYYSSPAEPGGQGTFFFNTADPRSWGTFEIESTTFHEGVPGHHFQLALALETEGLHPVHSRLYLAAFNEGWALYTERLADELGLYSSDLTRVGMLSADSMRACRLVVDTGMHALGWTRDQAIDYMLANSPMTRRQVEGEIDRYLGMPGQALGYMIGRLEIDRSRRDAERALGERFDIGGFHEAVLGSGTVPLPVLRRNVDAWVSATGG